MNVVDPLEQQQETVDSGELTVLIVDDHRSFADLLFDALNRVPGMRCVGTASMAAEGIAMAAALQPTIVIMDIQMPKQDGLLATRQIREVAPDTVIAVVTAHSDPEWVSRAAQAGASGFIPKDGSLTEMIEVLQRLRPGQMLVAPSTFTNGPSIGHGPATETESPTLTPRELEVLKSLGQGLKAREIARNMGISLHTCRGYLKSLHTKLGASTQLEVVIKGQNLGLIGSPVGP
jgi:DNA-binding NarL/FixJ family response regulator